MALQAQGVQNPTEIHQKYNTYSTFAASMSGVQSREEAINVVLGVIPAEMAYEQNLWYPKDATLFYDEYGPQVRYDSSFLTLNLGKIGSATFPRKLTVNCYRPKCSTEGLVFNASLNWTSKVGNPAAMNIIYFEKYGGSYPSRGPYNFIKSRAPYSKDDPNEWVILDDMNTAGNITVSCYLDPIKPKINPASIVLLQFKSKATYAAGPGYDAGSYKAWAHLNWFSLDFTA